MHKGIRYTLLILLVLPNLLTAATLDSLWAQHNKTTQTEKKIALILSIYNLNKDKTDYKAADSAIELAIDMVRLSGKDSLSVEVYKSYFIDKNFYLDEDIALEHANEFSNIASRYHNDNWQYWANISVAKVLIEKRNYENAIDKINKANYFAGLTDDPALIVDCYITFGKCQELNNKKIEAFRSYLNALNHAQKVQDHALISKCHQNLSFFYLLISSYERAKEYKIKELAYYTSTNADSLKIIKRLSDLSIIYYYNKERKSAEKITNKIVAYAKAHNEKEFFKTALFNHRVYLTENGLFNDLANFYTKQYPDELIKLSTGDTTAYYRIMAYINEVNHNIDSSDYYFKKAESRILEKRSGDYLYVSTFLKRYAQYLLRTGNNKLALEKMQASYENAKQVDYLPYLVETTQYLDSLNFLQGNIKEAYTYAKLHKEYCDEQEATVKQDALLLMEIDNETKQREIIAKQEEEHTERRHNLQYMGIIIAIFTAFIILIMMGSFKVPKVIIRSMGFFSFIFFFEFIILLADHKIMEITHHEPWKMLGIKIVIISFMLPFHHWLEHKVTHFLIEHQLVDSSWLNNKMPWKKKSKPLGGADLPDNSEL